MTKTIFIPHEENESSTKAIKYAIEIAKGLKMDIKLVRVVPEILDFSTMSHWNAVERKRVKKALDLYRKNIHEQEAEKLQKHLSWVNSKGITGSATVVEGVNAAEKIIELIRRDRPYLVVIASKRLKQKGRLAKLRMLGSVARRLAEESASPVLIVK